MNVKRDKIASLNKTTDFVALGEAYGAMPLSKETSLKEVMSSITKLREDITLNKYIEEFQKLLITEAYHNDCQEYFPKDKFEIELLLTLRNEEVLSNIEMIKRIEFNVTVCDKIQNEKIKLFKKL